MRPLRIQETWSEILFLMCPQGEDFLEGAVLEYCKGQPIIRRAFYRQVRERIQVLLELDLIRCAHKFQLVPG